MAAVITEQSGLDMPLIATDNNPDLVVPAVGDDNLDMVLQPAIDNVKPNHDVPAPTDNDMPNYALFQQWSVPLWEYVLTATTLAPHIASLNIIFLLFESGDVKLHVQCRMMLEGIRVLSAEVHRFLVPRPPANWTPITSKGLEDLARLLVTTVVIIFVWTLTEYDPHRVRYYGLLGDCLVIGHKHGRRVLRWCRLLLSWAQPSQAVWAILVLLVAWFVNSKPWNRLQPSLNGAAWFTLGVELWLDTAVRFLAVMSDVRGRVVEECEDGA